MDNSIVNVYWNPKTQQYTLRYSDGSYETISGSMLTPRYESTTNFGNIVLKSEIDERDDYGCSIFSCSHILRALRCASIEGYTIGGNKQPGSYRPAREIENQCIMGYDIEMDSTLIINNDSEYHKVLSLPLPTDTISCASLSCSCGYEKQYRTRGIDPDNKSTDLSINLLVFLMWHKN